MMRRNIQQRIASRIRRSSYFVLPYLECLAPFRGSMRLFSTTTLWSGKVIPYKLTDIGEGINEVQVLEVFVKEGDHVEEMDKICEVQSDKATVCISSRYTGVIRKVYATPDHFTSVGERLVDIELDEEVGTADASEPSQAETIPEVGKSGTRPVLASPATRSFAKQHNVDLNLVVPTGKGGYVTREDIENLLLNSTVDTSEPQACSLAGNKCLEKIPTANERGADILTDDKVIPITGVRRGMAQAMNTGANIPTLSFTEEVELSEMIKLSALLKEMIEGGSTGTLKLTYLPLFIKSASMALKEFPEVNAHCAEDLSKLICKKSHNIGFAMATPNGLVVPTIRDVQSKSVFEIAREIQTLMDKGQHNQITTEDMSNPTFTISNIGSIGSVFAIPTLVPPQVAIAALGRIQPLPRFDKNDNLIKLNIMAISFTADHRVIDGATMVEFSHAWKKYLEHPQKMLLHLR